MIGLTNIEAQILAKGDINSAFNLFDNTFRQVLNKLAPLKFHRGKNANKCPKWFKNSLKNLRTRRNKAHSKWKKEPKNKCLLEKFQKIRNRLQNEIKTAKKKFYSDKFLNCIGDSRQTYKVINDIIGKSIQNVTVPFADSLKSKTVSSQDLAESFNDFFSRLGTDVIFKGCKSSVHE